MAGLTIGTDKNNARFFLAVAALIFLESLNLIPISIGILGPIWPIPAVWAIGAWVGSGPSIKYASALFIIGIFMDILSSTNLGTFAAIYLLTYGAYLLHIRFLGNNIRVGFFEAIIICFYLIIACLFVGVFAKQWPNLLALFMPMAITIALFPFMSKLFKTDETSK